MASAPGTTRLVDVLASISLATDLGTGQVPGHGLRTCVLASAIAREMGLAQEDVRTVHHTTLLRFLGCTSTASTTARTAGGDDLAFNRQMAPVLMGGPSEVLPRLLSSTGRGLGPLARVALWAQLLVDPDGGRRTMAVHCEVGAMLARRLGVGEAVVHAVAHGHERWDGRGAPAGLVGEEIPAAVAIAVLARDVDLIRTLGEDPGALVRARAGSAYSPDVVAAFLRTRGDEADGTADELALVRAAEPHPHAVVGAADLDQVLAVLADFADLVSPWLRGHSRAVSRLVDDAAGQAGLPPADAAVLRRAALCQDVGRVAVPAGIWDKPGPLTTPEREVMQLHAHHGEAVLRRWGAVDDARRVSATVHERIDGSGYPRGLDASSLPPHTRLLAAADTYRALVADRPHRPALRPDQAAAVLEGDRGLDPAAVGCVLAAAGQRPAAAGRMWPAGLTEREVQVLQLIAVGATSRSVASRLSISPKTVGRHIEHIYAKCGVSSRAAAAVFAMGHGLLPEDAAGDP